MATADTIQSPTPATVWPGVIRLATDEDGSAIGVLIRDAGVDDYGADWSQPGIGAWWIVAEREGRLVGAIQVCPSQPVGTIGGLIVSSSERARRADGGGSLMKRPGVLARLLLGLAVETLRRQGVEFFMAIGRNDPAQHLYDFLGARTVGTSPILMRRTA